MATSHPTQHSRSQSEDESEPAEQGFEIVDVDRNLYNRGALSESNGNAHRHRPNTLAFALPTSFRSPSNHGNEEDDDDDDDEEEEVIEDDDDEPAPASSTRTFMHLPFTKIKTPQKAIMTNIFMMSLLCLLGGVGVAVHFVRRYSGDRTTVIAINKNLAFTAVAVGGYNFVEVFDADSLGGECTDITNERYNYISFNLDNDGNVTECAEKCTNCPGQGQVDGQPLLGFTVEVEYNSCFCNLDATASGYGTATCPDAVGASTGYGTPQFSGTGDIVSTDGDSSYACYKVVQTSSKSNKKPKSSSKGDKTPIRIRN